MIDVVKMVQSGFEGVREEMNKQFEEVHGHLQIIDGRLDGMGMELIDIKKIGQYSISPRI